MPRGKYIRGESREQFFWTRTVRAGEDDCWLWQGDKASGYGYAQGRELAHRASYSINIGPIPPGMSVLHKCDNSLCVNPKHLYAGTQQQNMRDRGDRYPFPKGARGVGAKLTSRDVKIIRAIQRSTKHGVTQERLTNIIRNSCFPQLSLSAIRDVLSGRNWQHVA